MPTLARALALVAKNGGEDVAKPSTLTSTAAGALDVPSLGLGTQIHGVGQGIANMILGGHFRPGYQKGVNEYNTSLADLASAHPFAFTGGGVGSSLLLPMGGAVDAESGLRGAVAGQSGERALIPGIVRGTATGGVAGTTSGLLHQDLTDPNYASALASGGEGAGMGIALGGLRGSYNSLRNSAQFRLNEALSIDEPLVQSALDAPHSAGMPTLAEMSPTAFNKLRAMTRVNPFAAQLGAKNLQRVQSAVTNAKTALENDPHTGYDALLNNRWFTDPPTVSAWQDLTGDNTPSVSARDLFEKYKEMSQYVRNVKVVKSKGVGVVSPEANRTAVDYGAKLKTFSQALSSIPGFSDLQSQVAPYLQREATLGRLITHLNQGARGQMGEAPATKKLDQAKQELGYTTNMANVRGATDLAQVLTVPHGQTTLTGLRSLLNPYTPTMFQANRFPGSIPGTAGLLAGVPTPNKRPGILGDLGF